MLSSRRFTGFALLLALCAGCGGAASTAATRAQVAGWLNVWTMTRHNPDSRKTWRSPSIHLEKLQRHQRHGNSDKRDMTSAMARLCPAASLIVMPPAATLRARSAPVLPTVALNMTVLAPAQVVRDFDRGHVPNRTGEEKPLRNARQQQLEHGIDDAYVEAHRAPVEEVTNAQDGTDRVYRIKTPYGVNACLNWRDVDRFNKGKGKALFVGACNR